MNDFLNSGAGQLIITTAIGLAVAFIRERWHLGTAAAADASASRREAVFAVADQAVRAVEETAPAGKLDAALAQATNLSPMFRKLDAESQKTLIHAALQGAGLGQSAK